MPDECQPQDELARLVLHGMRERGLTYEQLGAAVDAPAAWLYRLVRKNVKPNPGRLARLAEALDLDPDTWDAAVADRYLVRKPAADPDYDWVKTKDGAVEALVTAYGRLTPKQRAQAWRLLQEAEANAPRMPDKSVPGDSSGR